MSIVAIPGGVRLEVHLQPGASRTEVAGLHGDRLKIRIAAPPVDGKANAALIAWIAAQCGVPRTAVRLVRGAASRRKTVDIGGVSAGEVRKRLMLS